MTLGELRRHEHDSSRILEIDASSLNTASFRRRTLPPTSFQGDFDNEGNPNSTMHAEIIAIGTELTSGAKLDTNSQWLSLQLAEIGIPVRYHLTVADDLPAMIEAFKAAADRADIVLITGGLGPTLDDVTRQALAEMVGVELVLHEPSLEFIKSLFARRNYSMPDRNAIQAMFPQGSEPLANPRGTAPGIWMEIPRTNRDVPCRLAALPGVPSEMKRMYHEELLQRLPEGGRVIQRACVNCFGLGESAAEEMLGELTSRGRDPEVGITVHEATISLRIVAHGQTSDECVEKIVTTKQTIRRVMGDYVFGEEDHELEHAIIDRLTAGQLTLSTAEAGTCGLLAQRLADAAESGNCYLGGVVLPEAAAHSAMLGIDREPTQRVHTISAEFAGEMAKACRDRFQSDYALAVTECPEYDPEDAQSDVPHAYIALAGEGLLEVRKHTLLGDTSIVKSRAAKAILNLLRLHLLND